ncbi:hypothetical protein QQ045_014047 [Rhodiola kirilowii]
MSTNWSMPKDVQLCISYYRQSVDPITGTRQKVDKLWEKVDTDFQANWVRGEDEIITTNFRSKTALQSRFAKLKPNLVLWSSCIAYARRNPESGCNLQNGQIPPSYTYQARSVVEEEHTLDVPPTPSTEVSEFSTPESNPGSSTSPIRPPGVKAAKEARRKYKKVTNPLTNEALMTIVENQCCT